MQIIARMGENFLTNTPPQRAVKSLLDHGMATKLMEIELPSNVGVARLKSLSLCGVVPLTG